MFCFFKMQNNLFVTCALLCAIGICTAYVVLPDSINVEGKYYLGAKQCTWGPSYWCSNLTNAAGCKAVPHCIQTVWQHQNLPADNDSICSICKEMVKEARDTLESNETMENLKAVFDGSCKLIPVKIVEGECEKLANEFIPELVETLASEMDPSIVCSVAGLCNSARIDALLLEHYKTSKITAGKQDKQDTELQAPMSSCDGCHSVVDVLSKKFNAASKSDVLHGFLEVCAQMSSFSDSCSNIVLTYFPNIYNHLKTNLNADEVCLLSGECSENFHVHADVSPLSSSGVIPINNNGQQDPDIQCKLCEQLVQHLKDLLVANTTELEFQKVLEGVCKQMGGFADECVSIVDQYYAEIYNTLIQFLDGKETCTLMGLCPNSSSKKQQQGAAPLIPLLLLSPNSDHATKLADMIASDKKPSLARVSLSKAADSTVRISESTRLTNIESEAQLPIERLSPKTLTLMGNTELCTMCEYFLHYVQQAITQPSTEEEIKRAVDKVCDVLPKTLHDSCYGFVGTYGEAMVAILAQEIDPSQACPMLSLCPAAGDHDVEVFIKQYGSARGADKSNCPMCLFAVDELESIVKNNRTKENVKEALSKLCAHLSKNLAAECNDFVNTYTDELVEMLLSDFTPQEVCVYLKLCNDTKFEEKQEAEIALGGIISTNEIPDSTANGKTLIVAELVAGGAAQQTLAAKPQCILCEFVMSQIENELEDNKTDEAIKSAVLNVCKHLPKTVKKECTDFVEQHGDQVIQLLIATMDPQKVCGMMGLCGPTLKQLHLEVEGCTVCQLVVQALDKLLQNPNIDHKIEHLFKKACRGLPHEYKQQCETLIATYGDAIFEQLTRLADPSSICSTINVCGQPHHLRHRRDVLIGSDPCTSGPSFWCASLENAQRCNVTSVTYCQKNVWNGPAPLSGSNKCTWGPAYWCQNLNQANECGGLQHCQENVWKASAPKA